MHYTSCDNYKIRAIKSRVRVKCKSPLPLSLMKAAGQGTHLIKLAATDSPTGEGSTIGAPGLNDSVRNGKR